MAGSKKIVFITGANTGIGLETVRALVQSSQAYHIFLGSRSVEKGTAAAASVEKEFPTSASSIEVIQIDITSDESIQAAFEKVKSGPGYIDVLVNNAGKPRALSSRQKSQLTPFQATPQSSRC